MSILGCWNHQIDRIQIDTAGLFLYTKKSLPKIPLIVERFNYMSEQNATLRTRPCVMIIRDGWGYNPRPEEDAYNSIKLAKPPVDAKLMAEYPNCLVRTYGEDVGLPDGTMGNSEVGHRPLRPRPDGWGNLCLTSIACIYI